MSFNSLFSPAKWHRALLFITLSSLLVGCAGNKPRSANTTGGSGGSALTEAYVDLLRVGDEVEIVFSGNPTPPADQKERIKEDGTINLQFVGAVKAEGKSAGLLQKEVQELYVPKYFQRLTVNLKSENRVFYVDGEVRRPDRFVYSGAITVLQAVAAAQGFTDFAARGRVELTRSTGEKFVIDARKAKDNPKLDLPVIPGDRIFVSRRSPWGG